jgi:hypothetical protein
VSYNAIRYDKQNESYSCWNELYKERELKKKQTAGQDEESDDVVSRSLRSWLQLSANTHILGFALCFQYQVVINVRFLRARHK